MPSLLVNGIWLTWTERDYTCLTQSFYLLDGLEPEIVLLELVGETGRLGVELLYHVPQAGGELEHRDDSLQERHYSTHLVPVKAWHGREVWTLSRVHRVTVRLSQQGEDKTEQHQHCNDQRMFPTQLLRSDWTNWTSNNWETRYTWLVAWTILTWITTSTRTQ